LAPNCSKGETKQAEKKIGEPGEADKVRGLGERAQVLGRYGRGSALKGASKEKTAKEKTDRKKGRAPKP